MIKTIFIPTSGSSTDDSVFATALAVARPMAAHLDFYHLRQTPWQAVVRAPHAEFAADAVVTEATERLRRAEEQTAAHARKHFEEFCSANRIAVQAAPAAHEGVSASFSEESDHAEGRFLFHARHSDLAVLGRRRNVDLMPENLIETLLLHSGRPIIIAPDSPPANVTGTIVVGWKESAEAARALGAAMPLVKLARRVVLAGVREDGDAAPEALDHLARQLAWHGIAAEARIIADASSPTAQRLLRAAAEIGADLLVAGGFSHRPLREAVFGGVTQCLIERAGLPVFMMH